MRRIGPVAVLVSLAVLTSPATAAFDCYVRVAQPHDQPEAGDIGLMYVTYELMLGSAWPGVEIRYTCAPGPVAIDHGRGYSGVENRNGANLLGFKVTVEDRSWGHSASRWSGPPGGEFIDTLMVTLDLRAAAAKLAREIGREPKSSSDVYQDNFDRMVACTVDCILDNATRSKPPIHHISLSVLGPGKYRSIAKVYAIRPVARLIKGRRPPVRPGASVTSP
jgi:hypothetical protein